jgi:hypothetical protein
MPIRFAAAAMNTPSQFAPHNPNDRQTFAQARMQI